MAARLMNSKSKYKLEEFLHNFYKQQEIRFRITEYQPWRSFLPTDKPKIIAKNKTNESQIMKDITTALVKEQKTTILFESKFVIDGIGLTYVTIKVEGTKWFGKKFSLKSVTLRPVFQRSVLSKNKQS